MNPSQAGLLQDIEGALHPRASVEQRLGALAVLSPRDPPEVEVVSAVVGLLIDADEDVRNRASGLLFAWHTHSVRGLMRTFRSTPKEEPPLRLAIIEQLRRMGTAAAIAEPMLQEAAKDPALSDAALLAIGQIRGDWKKYLNDLVFNLFEVVFLFFAVLTPSLVIQSVTKNHAKVPMYINLIVAILGTVALLMGRWMMSMQAIRKNETEADERWRRTLSTISIMVAGIAIGLFVGYLLGTESELTKKMFQHQK